MSETLLRCPFCGGEAKIDKTIANTVSVECTVCHASSRMILCTEGDIEQKAIEAWNTRKPMQNIVERLEETKTKSYVTGITSNPYEFGACHAMNDAIKIVKEEGEINDNT